MAFGVGFVVVVALCLWPTLDELAAEPSEEMFRYMAAIGATLLVAYAIAMSAIVTGRRNSRREALVGGIVAVGFCGLLAIAACLRLGERAEAELWTWLDQAGFAFSASSLFLLGMSVVLQPLFAYDFQGFEHFDSDED